MPSLEARLEGLLAEVKSLNEALDDEVQERRRDHDKLTELLTRYEGVTKLFDGFIQERTYDRGKLNGLKAKMAEIEGKVKTLETYKTERENSRTQARIQAQAEVKEKRKMRWDLLVALGVGLLCAVAGVMFERVMNSKDREKGTTHQSAPASKTP